MSWNCPDNSSVKSSRQGPPGKSVYSLELVPQMGTDSEETAEILDSLPLRALCFGDSEELTSACPWPLDEWHIHYPYWNEPNILARETIGDCYSMVADTILTQQPPFPGDNLYCVPDLCPELHFHIQRDEETWDYLLCDQWTGGQVVIP